MRFSKTSLHLRLATRRLLERITELRTLILALHLHVDLLDEHVPGRRLASGALLLGTTGLVAARVFATSVGHFLSLTQKIYAEVLCEVRGPPHAPKMSWPPIAPFQSSPPFRQQRQKSSSNCESSRSEEHESPSASVAGD